jgi:hypothetical protein
VDGTGVGIVLIVDESCANNCIERSGDGHGEGGLFDIWIIGNVNYLSFYIFSVIQAC